MISHLLTASIAFGFGFAFYVFRWDWKEYEVWARPFIAIGFAILWPIWYIVTLVSAILHALWMRIIKKSPRIANRWYWLKDVVKFYILRIHKFNDFSTEQYEATLRGYQEPHFKEYFKRYAPYRRDFFAALIRRYRQQA